MIKRFILLSLLVSAALLAPGSSMGATVEELLKGLESGDEAGLVRARQLLPHKEIETVGLVMPYLSNPDERVWRTAYNILADFAGEVTQPGREKERFAVATAYMSLILPETTDHSKEWGLRLLPLVVPDGFDLSPVANLLANEDWREKARDTLETIGNDEACGALRSALLKSEPSFQVALIRSLGHLRDTKSLPVLTTLLSDQNAEVRSAAALAVAFSGDLRFFSPLKVTLERATPETREEALTAWMRLAESLSVQSEHRKAAAGAYRTILESSAGLPLESAAIVGLGRIGEATGITAILTRLSAEGGKDLEPAAAAAFRATVNAEGRAVWTAAFPSLSDSLKYSLLVAMGAEANRASVPVMLSALEGASEEVRQAAYEALSHSDSPEAVDPLIEYSKKAEGDERERARDYLENLAAGLDSSDLAEASHRVYLELYRSAETPEKKAGALEGMAQSPSPESLDLFLEAAQRGEASAAISKALARLVQRFRTGGEKEKEGRALAALLENAKTAEGVRLAYSALSEGGDADEALRDLGFLLDWRVGPSRPWEPSQGLSDEALAAPDFDPTKLTPREGLEGWKSATASGFPPTVNLAAILGQEDHKIADAFTLIESPEDQEAVFLFGSDDGIKAWLNGQAILENPVDRGADIDQDRATGQLKKGKNLLVVRITQGGGGWNFLGRMSDPEGKPLRLPSAVIQE